MKILAVCDTIEFINRATMEALARDYGNVRVLCKRNINKVFEPRTRSAVLPIDYVHTLFPPAWLEKPLFAWLENKYFAWTLHKYRNQADVLLVLNVHGARFLEFFPHAKKVGLLIDPEVILSDGNTLAAEKHLVRHVDLLLCTSQQLADVYCQKYLQHPVKGVYWPNTVDLSVWREGLAVAEPQRPQKVAGYIGNFNQFTVDLDLLDRLIHECPQVQFQFAGRINFAERLPEQQARFRKLMAEPNVRFLGFVPQVDIPKVVATWDLCLTLDPINEPSKYIHHNKVYQYLAMGRQVLTTHTHDDYRPLHPAVREADDHDDYLAQFKALLEGRLSSVAPEQAMALARQNDSRARARQLMSTLAEHFEPALAEPVA